MHNSFKSKYKKCRLKRLEQRFASRNYPKQLISNGKEQVKKIYMADIRRIKNKVKTPYTVAFVNTYDPAFLTCMNLSIKRNGFLKMIKIVEKTNDMPQI